MKPSAFILTNALLLSSLLTLSCRPKQLEEPILVSARDLLSDYLAAPPARVKQLRYNNRKLRVSGVLARVKAPEGLLILRGKEDPTILNGVNCQLGGPDLNYELLEKLSQLREDDQIVVEGQNRGFEFGFVELVPCIIK